MKALMKKVWVAAVLVAMFALFGCQKNFSTSISMSEMDQAQDFEVFVVVSKDTTIRGVVNDLIIFPFNGNIMSIYISAPRSLNLWDTRGCNPLYARPPIEGRDNVYLSREMGNGQIILAVVKNSLLVIKVDGVKIN